MPDEETPLLWDSSTLSDPHQQFCRLSGVPPSNMKFDKKHPFVVGPKTLYGRTTNAYASARRSYSFMSGLNNTLLLSQVILGATLTALGASESSHILITCFGVMNTVIAGLVAYMKSRGQPARARLYRDDLEMVLNQIEDSEIMWLGIAQGIHGYDDIDIDDKVTVRSEVARLMRLYDKARKSFILSNPDNYLMGQSDNSATALKSRAGVGGGFPPAPPVTLPVVSPAPPVPAAGPPTVPATAPSPPPVEEGDTDESPASAPIKPAKDFTPPPTDAKENASGSDKQMPANNSSSSSTKPQDAPKDDPPSYNNSQDANKENLKPAPVSEDKPAVVPAKEPPQPATPQPPPTPTPTPAPAPTPALEADPDESPASAARGFERSRSRSDDDKKSSKGKAKDTTPS